MATFLYHDSIKYRLGMPIDPNQPFQRMTVGGFFDIPETHSTSDIGAEVKYEIFEVNSYKELNEALSIDASIEAKSIVFNGKATFNYDTRSSKKENTILFIINATKIYSEEDIKGVLELTKKGEETFEELGKDGDIFDFQSYAGSEIITSIIRGQSLSLVYKFVTSDSTYTEKIRSTLNLKWRQAEVKIDFEKELSSIDKYLQLEIKAYQTGIGVDSKPEQNIGSILKVSPGDLPAIKIILAGILNKVTKADRDASPVIRATSSSIKTCRAIIKSKFRKKFEQSLGFYVFVDKKIIELAEIKIKLLSEIDFTNELLESWSKATCKEGSQELTKAHLKSLNKIDFQILEIYEKLLHAKEKKDLDIEFPEVPTLLISDVIRLPLIRLLRWESKNNNSCSGEQGYFNAYYYPVIQIKFIKAISFMILTTINSSNEKSSYLIKGDEFNDIIKNSGSFENVWRSSHSGSHYVWGCHGDLQIYWANIYFTSFRENERHAKTYLEIFDREGNISKIELGNGAEPIFPVEDLEIIPQGIRAELKIAN